MKNMNFDAFASLIITLKRFYLPAIFLTKFKYLITMNVDEISK